MCFTAMSREGCRWMMLPVVCVHSNGKRRERKSSGGYRLGSKCSYGGRRASWFSCMEGREGRGGKGREKYKFAILGSSCNVAILNVHGSSAFQVSIVLHAIHVPSLFGDPSGDSDFVVAADKALAKCKSTSS